jgi:hypothetical protein
MKCADVAKEFVGTPSLPSTANYKLQTFIDKFKSCEDFPKEPEKFEEIQDFSEMRCAMSFYSKGGIDLSGKRWKVTFEEMPE